LSEAPSSKARNLSKMPEAMKNPDGTPAESFLRRLGISEAVALAGLTALGYYYAFAYETGYLSHFGIPAWVIDLSLVNVLVVVGVFATVLTFIVLTFQTLPGGPWWALLVHLGVLIGIGGFTVVAYKVTNWASTWEIVVGIILVAPGALLTLGYFLSRLILPIFLHKDKGSWLDRWAFVLRREWASAKPNLLDHTVSTMDKAGLRASTWLAPIYFLAILAPIAVRLIGVAAANTRSEYVVVGGEPECVVVRKYDDYAVCAAIDRKSRRVVPAFRLIQLGDSAARLFRTESLGRLKAPDIAAIQTPPPVSKTAPAASSSPSSTKGR
jgi:hypothetical protein